MSDLSSTGSLGGIEDYITGYPLRELNTYVLAKTWLAPESDRPGSVWTHSLLVPFGELPYIGHPGQLVSLFKRPIMDSLSIYESPLKTSVSRDLKGVPEPRVSRSLLKELIQLLYEDSSSDVVLPMPPEASLRNILLDLWMQQWPALRRSFAFSTASPSPRSFKGEVLSAQFVTQRSVQKSSIRTNESNRHIEFLVDDVLLPSADFRKFCVRYGADMPVEGQTMLLMAHLYDHWKDISTLKELNQLVQLIWNKLPSSESGHSLKRDLLGRNELEYRVNLSEILLRLDDWRPLGKLAPPISDTLLELVTNYDNRVVELLSISQKTHPPLYSLSINRILESAPTPSIVNLMRSNEYLSFEFASLDPSILLWNDLYEPDFQTLLGRLLDHTYSTWSERIDIADAIARRLIHNRQYELAGKFVLDENGAFARSALNSLSNLETLGEAKQFARKVLSSNRLIAIEWLAESPQESLRFLATDLSNISVNEVAHNAAFSVSSWNNYAQTRFSLEPSEQKFVDLFYLELGILLMDGSGFELVCTSFESVYRRFYRSEYDVQDWLKLAKYLPGVDKHDLKHWDRCRALRISSLFWPDLFKIKPQRIMNLIRGEEFFKELQVTFWDIRKDKSVGRVLDPFWLQIFGTRKKGIWPFNW